MQSFVECARDQDDCGFGFRHIEVVLLECFCVFSSDLAGKKGKCENVISDVEKENSLVMHDGFAREAVEFKKLHAMTYLGDESYTADPLGLTVGTS